MTQREVYEIGKWMIKSIILMRKTRRHLCCSGKRLGTTLLHQANLGGVRTLVLAVNVCEHVCNMWSSPSTKTTSGVKWTRPWFCTHIHWHCAVIDLCYIWQHIFHRVFDICSEWERSSWPGASLSGIEPGVPERTLCRPSVFVCFSSNLVGISRPYSSRPSRRIS